MGDSLTPFAPYPDVFPASITRRLRVTHRHRRRVHLEAGYLMTARPAGGRGKNATSALDAVAEALVLVDPQDAFTLEELLTAVRGLAKAAPRGAAGEATRTAMTEAEAAVERMLASEDPDIATELTTVASSFETARTSLTHRPTLERSKAGSGEGASAETTDAAPSDNPLADDPELVGDFVTRAQEHLDSADSLLLTLEQTPDDHGALDAAFRVFHTIKGMAGFLGFTEIERFAHDTESFLDGPRKGKEKFTPEAFDAVFAAVDGMRVLVSARAELLPKTSRQAKAVADAAKKAEAPKPAATAVGAVTTPVSQPITERTEAGRRVSDTIVRVDEERLDLLLDTIGELVIAESMASEAARTDVAAWAALGEKFSRLDKITRELQEMATSLRMVPLKGTFGRMARLVRDLSQKAGKQVEFVVEGEDTELDKAMVDLIYDPLVHLVRNAMDHGLEPGADRPALGKPVKGTLTLRAYHAGGSVCVEVEDDGRGLNKERILAQARKNGIVTADASLTDRETYELVFTPGFTTAKEVTDVSGRGVGMDVVKRAVEGLRGTVDVSTTPGIGTRFTLRLPLTLAIIDGMVLRVGNERYVLPTLVIQRSLRPTPEEITTVLDRGELLATDDGMVPLVRLARLFETPDADVPPHEGIVVLVGDNEARAGLVATELLGQQQTVIKPLGEGVANTPGVSGGAIMPDGNVGLILDVSGLIRLARAEVGERA